jgi:hypothetical protein
MNQLDPSVGFDRGPEPMTQAPLLARDAFLSVMAHRLQRPNGLPGDVPFDVLGFDFLERYAVLTFLAEWEVPIDENLAAALLTLDDAYEQYALAMVGVL